MRANVVVVLLLAAECAVARPHPDDEERRWVFSSRPPLMQTPKHPSRFLASKLEWLASHTRRDASPAEETAPPTTTNPWSLPANDMEDVVEYDSSSSPTDPSSSWVSHTEWLKDNKTTWTEQNSAVSTSGWSYSSEHLQSSSSSEWEDSVAPTHPTTRDLIAPRYDTSAHVVGVGDVSRTPALTAVYSIGGKTSFTPIPSHAETISSVDTYTTEVAAESLPLPIPTIKSDWPELPAPEVTLESSSAVVTSWTEAPVADVTSVEVVVTSIVPMEMRSVEYVYSSWVPVEVAGSTTWVFMSSSAPSSTFPEVRVAIPTIVTPSAASSSISSETSTIPAESSVDVTSSTTALLSSLKAATSPVVAVDSSVSSVKVAESSVVPANNTGSSVMQKVQPSSGEKPSSSSIDASTLASTSIVPTASSSTTNVSSFAAVEQASSSAAARIPSTVPASAANVTSIAGESSSITAKASSAAVIEASSISANASSVAAVAQTSSSIIANVSSNSAVAAASSSAIANVSSVAALASTSVPGNISAAASQAVHHISSSAAPAKPAKSWPDQSSSVYFHSEPWPASSSSSSEYFWESSSSAGYFWGSSSSSAPSSSLGWGSVSETASASAWRYPSSSSSRGWEYFSSSSGIPFVVSSSGIPFEVSSSSAPSWPIGTGHSWPLPPSSTYWAYSSSSDADWSYPTPTHPASTPLVWGPSDLPNSPKPPCSYATDSYTSTEYVTVTPCKAYHPTCTQTKPIVSTRTSCVPTTYTVTATSSSYCPPEYYTKTWDSTVTITNYECEDCWATPSIWTTPTQIYETYTVPPSFSWDFPVPTATGYFNHTPHWAPPQYTTSTCYGYTVSTYRSTSIFTWSLPAFVTVCPAASTPAPWSPPEYTEPASPVVWKNSSIPAPAYTPNSSPQVWNASVAAPAMPFPETYAPYTPEAPATWATSTYGSQTVVYSQPPKPVGETSVFPPAPAPPVETAQYAPPPVESSPVEAPPPIENPPPVEAPPPAQAPPPAVPPKESSPVAMPPVPPVSAASTAMELSGLRGMVVPLCVAVILLWN